MRISTSTEARDAAKAARAEHAQALAEWQASPSDGRWEKVRSLEARVAQFDALVARFDAQEVDVQRAAHATRADELRGVCSHAAFIASLAPEVADLARLAAEVQAVAARVESKVRATRAAHVELTEILREIGGDAPSCPVLVDARGAIRRGLGAALKGDVYLQSDALASWLEVST